MIDPEPAIHVAAAVLERDDGRVLLAERPADKPWAGYWELPGGKIEPGEPPVQALARELREELGIDIDAAWAWLTYEHTHTGRRVRLHFYRVPGWRGTPHGREGQRLSWEDPRRPAVGPLLPANDRLLAALALPALYAITCADAYGEHEFFDRLRAALARGVRLIQVRERFAPEHMLTFARQVVALAHDAGAQVLINADVTLAQTVGADGVHLPSAALTARPPLPLCAASCHNAAELAQAAAIGADFAVLSPVLRTASHPGAATLGWARFSELRRDCPLPVYALGGMRPELLATARQHGAHGVALRSGIW